MGLFPDNYYDPNSYAPIDPNAGLLERLKAMVEAAPVNASASSPMDANAAMPAAPAPAPQLMGNAPIDIGGYQMPRIGSGFPGYPEHDPQTGETIAPQAVAAPAPQQLATPSLLQSAPQDGLGDHLMAGYQNFHNRGGLIGSIVAAVTGKRNDPVAEAQATQQQILQRQYAARIAAGQSPQQAMLAVLSPETAKTIDTQTFGPKTPLNLGGGYVLPQGATKAIRTYEPDDKFQHVTAKNADGSEALLSYDPSTGKYTGSTSAANSAPSALGDMSKTGPEYLATLPPQEAGIVKAMVEGRQPPPGVYAMGKQACVNRIAAAQQVDPTFDQTTWSGRVAGVKDFASGKSSEMVRSANQTLHHINGLLDSADALHNGNYPALNWAGNKLNEATGGGEPTSFVINAHAVADEMGKVFKGANLSDSEIHAWADNLSPNMSPAQQRAAVGKMTELLHGALDALDEKRVASIGQVAADKAGPIIKPEGQAVLKRIDAWLKAGNGAGALPSGWTVKVN